MIEQYGILTFDSTHHAIKAESDLKKNDIKTKTIPTPRDITLSCGIAIRGSVEDLDIIKSLIDSNKLMIKAIHLLTINNGSRELEKLL